MPDLYTVLLGLLFLLPLLGNLFFPHVWLDMKKLLGTMYLGYKYNRGLQRKPAFTMVDIFLAKVQKHPAKPLILFGDEVYTYQDIDRLSNQAARAFQSQVGLKEGETLAVFLQNSPVYVWVWLALAKIGCAMSCINYNARSKILLHAIRSCDSKILLTTPDFKTTIEDVLPSLRKEGIRVFYLSDNSPTEGVEALLGQIKSSSTDPVPISFRASITSKSTSVYIFTSGTTGLPKAAIINQSRLLRVASVFSFCGVSSKDIIYTPLPLYHSAGLLLGIGGSLEVGATCVLKSKFSVSQFWDDCRRYRVSVIQYVGETMRYLCNAPQKENDRDHSVRKACGNGIRMEVWKEFLRRFGSIQIYEFYGATESNIGFVNYTGKVGAVGRSSLLLQKLTPYELLQYDPDTGEPVRNKKGYCIPIAPGETGLLVAKITNSNPFAGYAGDRQKSEKKLLQDVLKKGDYYFNTGDLLRIDHEGFVYFQDRVGDTFRWKGENVATTEVEEILTTVKFIQEVNVYGVSVPGHEGRIGMAAIQLKEGLPFDGGELYRHAKEYLPKYAIPHFIRIQKALEVTGTFKHIKGQLVKEGFDLAAISDPLFFLDESEKCYVPLTQKIYNSIAEQRQAL
ncbi:long-chain fatty acid transport protein 5 [Eublepharis macularius]|uniref:long-chain-fatty-acid--CoA ligase n=1 Tax=Eublepharis macularius TaxID=481883 RepID=A0AA97K4P3_EUBMA|nr:long-chain fatty acid transport protein 5 [Eublepharis macularius]